MKSLPRRSRLRAWWLIVVVLAGCGAKTGLRVPVVPVDAPEMDVPDVHDVPVLDELEACVDPMGCVGPQVHCSAGGATTAGVVFALSATATAGPRSSVVGQRWAVTASPPRSATTLSSPTQRATDFTGDSAGAYNIRYTATDGEGRAASCDVPVVIAPTYRGTEFWAISTTNSQLIGGDVFHFAVAVGNGSDAAVSATVTGGALTAPVTFMIPPRSAVTQALPWVLGLSHNTSTIRNMFPDCCDAQCCRTSSACEYIQATPPSSSLVSGGAYRIVTTASVSMYQFNPLEFGSQVLCAAGTSSYTNDASLLLPTPALTGHYLVLAHNAWSEFGSYVTIAATRPGDTRVIVTPSANIRAGAGVTGGAAGVPQTFTLHQGDVVQLVTDVSDDSFSPVFQTPDMTGTVIDADGPVAVFSGVDCTNMSYPNGTEGACDHIEEQLFPTETWGRDVIVTQLRDRISSENYMVRILSAVDGNRLTFTPASVHAPVTLARGRFVEFESRADFEVVGTQPILVGQYMEGQGTTPTAEVGDPAFVLEVPAPQYRSEYTFVIPTTYTANFLNLVIGNTGSVSIDGVTPSFAGTPIQGSAWRVLRVPISPGSHRVTSGAPFGLKVIGVAAYTSYAYPGGLDLQTL